MGRLSGVRSSVKESVRARTMAEPNSADTTKPDNSLVWVKINLPYFRTPAGIVKLLQLVLLYFLNHVILTVKLIDTYYFTAHMFCTELYLMDYELIYSLSRVTYMSANLILPKMSK